MAERHLRTPLSLAFQEKADAELCTLNSRLNERLKEDITREVYNRNILKHKEDALVAQIRLLGGEKECDVGSPDSDIFVTPKASPSDPHFVEPFQGDSHKVYYSLVHFEERNQQVLEKELAEQDELSKSFRSLISKEIKQKPTIKSNLKSKIPSKKNVPLKLIKPQPFNIKLKHHSEPKTKLELKLQDELNMNNILLQSVGQREDEIMSNPDSVLEPVSSGYVTGCSPRDTNGSEALGADSTEVATSEDIPHDDKSRASSSVSSDPGTWDSTFPTNDDTCIEKDHSDNVTNSECVVFSKENSSSKINAPPGNENNIKSKDLIESDKYSEYLCDFSEKSDSFINLKIENQYSSSMKNEEYSSSNSNSNNFFIDAASLRDENEMYLPNIQNPIFSSTNTLQPKTLNCDEISNECANDKSELVLRKIDAFLDKELNCTEQKGVEEEPVENRKLIRRNTFDLDPDDLTLNRLKEEYEKSQVTETPDFNSNNCQLTVSNNSPSKSKEVNSPFHKAKTHISHEEEIHSPDSLNNDFQVEPFRKSPSEKKLEVLNVKSPEKNEIEQNQVISMDDNKHLNSSDNTLIHDASVKVHNHDIPEPQDSTEIFVRECTLKTDDKSSKHASDNETSLELADSFSKASCFNKIEQTPIVSGGALYSAVSSSDYSVTASPLNRRKTEFAPILSGGFDDYESVEVKPIKPRASSSLSTSWVVDMSDSGKSPPDSINENKIERNHCSNSGLGFFVPLEDPYPSFDSFTSNSSAERSDSGLSKRSTLHNGRNSSCGFYVDLKENNIKDCNKSDPPCQEKKLFSMFIDIGNSKSSDSTSPKSKPGSPFFPAKRNKGPTVAERLTAKHLDKKSNSTSSDSGLDLGEHPEITKGRLLFNKSLDQTQIFSDSSNNDSGFITKRQSFFMFIGNEESPVTRRRTLPPGLKQNTNRHSWNSDYKHPFKSETLGCRGEHKRSSSVSYDESFNREQFPSGPTSIDDTVLKHKEKNRSALSSWHGPIKPSSELSRIISKGAKNEFKDKSKEVQKIECSEGDNIDKGEEMSCSIKSDDVFDVSNTTISSKDDANRTFVVDEVSKVVNINTNDLELSTPSHEIVSDLSKDDSSTDPVQDQISANSNKSSVCDADQNTPKFSEQSISQPVIDTAAGFVKLSDMDKEPSQQTWKTSVKGSSRMSRSIPEGTWADNRLITNSASSRSLSRLFPHLYPNSDSRADSLQSSLHSSFIEPSPIEVSTEEEGTSSSGGPCSRLGEDLLRMFLDEISPDVTVEVGGRRIKAHKCILSSRCLYFAGMLSGGWVESAGNVISLQGFAYNTVHFALCHIYSGASQIPDTINIVELATLADMLCLEGLKEVIMYTLKVKYCHFFHKPCSGCLVGVVECLPLAAAYSLDEIYRKSLRWITKHFVKVWPTKGFASLPKELHDKCFKQHIVHMSNENVLEIIMSCDKLDATIPNVRWASSVFSLNSKLHEATVKYLGQHFAAILGSHGFMNLGQEDSWTVTRLEETLVNVSKSLSPDQACQSYKKIKATLSDIKKSNPEVMDWKLEFLELLTRLEISIEDCLIRQAGRAARTSSWAKMDLALRRKIQEAACLVFAPGPRAISSPRDIGRTSKNDSKPKSPAPVPGSTRKTVTNLSQPSKTTQSPILKPKTPSKLSQVKSRYLDPKPARRDIPETQPRKMSGSGKAISSSDSSRTSSPATARVSRPGTSERRTPNPGRRAASVSVEVKSHNSKENSASTSREADSKVGGLKRQSTFRVATKASSAKQVTPVTKPVTRSRPLSNLPSKTSVNNNKNRPSLGTRSGPFLRDDSFQSTKKVQQFN